MHRTPRWRSGFIPSITGAASVICDVSFKAMRLLHPLSCLLLLSVIGCATTRPSAKIRDYGLYDVESVTVRYVETSKQQLPTAEGKNLTHIKTTTEIPCSAPQHWGFRLDYARLPERRPYEVRIEFNYPMMTLPGGEKNTRQTLRAKIEPGAKPDQDIVWHFLKDFDYELVPGDWTFQVFIDGTLVASKTFTVGQEANKRVDRTVAGPLRFVACDWSLTPRWDGAARSTAPVGHSRR
jgi:hypothetical protein